MRKDYITDPIETIYFGGGTPSILSKEDILEIFKTLEENFSLAPDPEITLEANPDDLSAEKLKELSQTPVNRLSIGIQSFHDADLNFLNRAHTAKQAEQSIQEAQLAGFSNITIDLIYGIQTSDDQKWTQNLQKVFDLNIPHLSAYCLTIEPKTAMEYFIKTGKNEDINEDQVVQQFEILMIESAKHGFDHYEISNFAKPQFKSRHNSSYWSGKKYIGYGPSAHSFDGISRQWNVANNAKYIKSIVEGTLLFEKETLTETNRLNEFIMTSLRTNTGLDLEKVGKLFGQDIISNIEESAAEYISNELLFKKQNRLTLTIKGKLLADKIISDLFEV